MRVLLFLNGKGEIQINPGDAQKGQSIWFGYVILQMRLDLLDRRLRTEGVIVS